MARLASECVTSHPEHAWMLVTRGLEVQPHHVELLGLSVELGKARGEDDTAAQALKTLAHMRLEENDVEGAREVLERAKALDPRDLVVREKCFALALEGGLVREAIEDGRHLADLYRTTGLHKKAVAVQEKLLALDPERWEFRAELAHARADCGEVGRAIEELAAYGKRFLQREEYEEARRAYGEITVLDPTHAEAERMLQHIDTGLLAFRRRRRRRALELASFALLAFSWVGWLAYEVVARTAYQEVVRTVHQRQLIENGRHAEAADLFRELSERFPGSTTSLWDVRTHVELLDAGGEH